MTFDNLLVEKRFGRGFEADNVAGSVTVNGNTQINNENSAVASAVDIRNSSGLFTFNYLQATGVKGSPGVNLQDNTGTTSVRTLDVTSDGATAVRAFNAGTFKINPAVNGVVDLTKGGTIAAVNGTAIDIEKTALEANLMAVSSSGAATGLRLVNDTGSFTVWGSGVDSSGGTIQGATTGVFLKDVETVGFNFMHFDGNGTGIDAENTKLLVFNNSKVINSTGFGLDTVDVQALNITNSIFQGNSGLNVNSQFSKVLAYSYTFNNSLFVSDASDNVLLAATGGGAGSSLNLFTSHVEFDNSVVGTTGMRVNWNGALSGTIDGNVFNGIGGTNTGLAVTNTGTTLTNLAITNNVMRITNGNGTGVNLNTVSSSQVSLVNNLVELSGASGTGFKFSTVSPTFTITSNTIRDFTGGSTGMLFDSLTGPGSVTLNSNLIDLSTQSVLLDRGIIFSSITNSIQLFGTQNNTIQNSAIDFAVPAGTTTGSVKINGANRP
ncbi:MAG: hypothetical protein NT069_33645 [Planctomycetota bacterium]|nr:hypothetical protein [Planctomycetota bacterium]